MSLLALLVACEAPVEAPPGEAVDLLVPLPAPLLLRRMSLDLRGVVPTTEELDRVEADPAALEELRDAYLDDPRLEERLVSFLGEQWLTRLDRFEIPYSDFGLAAEQEFEFERSVGEEPLRLMARVAVDDRPWSDIVTADHTMANELLAGIWPLEYPDGATGWQEATYTDGRPGVGVLATNGLWWRYVTNASNANRARVAAITRLLLCDDILSRPISFSAGVVSLADAEGTATAIRTQESCIVCHSTIEPLAATLFGFGTSISYNGLEASYYHPEREYDGETTLGVAPGYFGEPIVGLGELGPSIARDPRFWQCTARNMTQALWRRDVELSDFDRVESLRTEFLLEGGTLKPLLAAIVDTPEYKAGALAPSASAADLDRERTARMMTADQLASTVADLTGFVWTWDGFEQMANDDYGYRVLAGGVDGYNVSRPQVEPSLTWALTIKRLAEAGADYAVGQDLAEGASERRILQHVSLATVPGDAAFTTELEELHWRLYARRPEAERIAAAVALWEAVEAEDGARAAWSGLVSAMLRDPEFVGY